MMMIIIIIIIIVITIMLFCVSLTRAILVHATEQKY